MQDRKFPRATLTVVVLWALIAPSAPATGGEFLVLCDVVDGRVVLQESADEDRHRLMAGPFPGERTATIWVEENCPGWLCDANGCGRERPPEAPAEGWMVVCDPGSGTVGMVEQPLPPGVLLLAGRDGAAREHPDRDEAQDWAQQNCSSWRCDGEGRCVGGATAGPGPSTGGWVAGEVTSVTLDAPPAGAASTVGPAGPTAGPSGPPAADLTPLINTTKAAADGCSFPAALASLEHMANFDPEHPFYVANLDKLRDLAKRQRQTEQTVWRASSFLTSGNLEGARDLAQMAAGTAVSCQNQAVAVLLDGIDTAIKQERTKRQLASRKAAAALLPGLVSLSRALSGAQGGQAPDPGALAASAAATFGYTLPANASDPCAFKFEYANKWSTEPACTCAGYVFDASRFRCVK